MKRRRIGFCAALFFAAAGLVSTAAFAQTYLGVRELGDPVEGAGARSVAMGSTVLARGGQAAGGRWNPAVLADFEKAEASFSLGPTTLTEKVATSAKEAHFRNSNYAELNELSIAVPLNPKRLWVGFSAAPAFDLHYHASQTILSSTGTPASQSRITDSGVIWAFTPAVAVAFTPDFSLGASYDFWFGNEKLSAFKRSFTLAATADDRETADYSGGAARIGLRWRANDGLSFGVMFQPSGKLSRRFDLTVATSPTSGRSGTDAWTMPPKWGLGLSYRVEGEHATELAADIIQTAWHTTKVNGDPVNQIDASKPIFREIGANADDFGVAAPSPRSYNDTVEIHVGIEHTLTPQWSLRYGFRHQPYFADRSVEATFFTAGVGYAASEKWGWSIAGEMGKRDYQGENLLYPTTQRVDETLRRILVSGRMRW
jgi:long-subunit fatty acid transport protein